MIHDDGNDDDDAVAIAKAKALEIYKCTCCTIGSIENDVHGNAAQFQLKPGEKIQQNNKCYI